MQELLIRLGTSNGYRELLIYLPFDFLTISRLKIIESPLTFYLQNRVYGIKEEK